jgi:hypothetical protein
MERVAELADLERRAGAREEALAEVRLAEGEVEEGAAAQAQNAQDLGHLRRAVRNDLLRRVLRDAAA